MGGSCRMSSRQRLCAHSLAPAKQPSLLKGPPRVLLRLRLRCPTPPPCRRGWHLDSGGAPGSSWARARPSRSLRISRRRPGWLANIISHRNLEAIPDPEAPGPFGGWQADPVAVTLDRTSAGHLSSRQTGGNYVEGIARQAEAGGATLRHPFATQICTHVLNRGGRDVKIPVPVRHACWPHLNAGVGRLDLCSIKEGLACQTRLSTKAKSKRSPPSDTRGGQTWLRTPK